MTPHLFYVKRAKANEMKRLDGLGLPVVGRALACRRAYSDGTGKYLNKKAATTPIGLPIPGSAYTKALARTLLRRALPLPAQILLELLELLKQPPDGVNIPPGWNVGCDNPTPSGTGTVTNQTWGAGRVGGACPPPVCLNNQALAPRGPFAGDCRMLLLAPGSIAGRYDVMRTIGADPGAGPCTAVCTGLPKPGYRQRWMFRDVPLNPPPGPDYKPWTKTKPDTKPKRITPEIDPKWKEPPVYPPPYVAPPKDEPFIPRPPWRWVPPEWADPNLAPELVPPTAPIVEPPNRPFRWTPTTPTLPATWQIPGRGTERGPPPPARAPSGRTNAPPIVVFDPRSGGTVRLPPAITTPVAIRGPGVGIEIHPPGSPPLVSKPPGPRVKERKLIVAVPAGAAKRLIGGVTEGLDMIDCLHDALPKHLQARRLRRPPSAGKHANHRAKPSWKRKAAAVYKAFAQQADAIEGGIEHGQTPNYVLTANDIMNAVVTCGQQQFMDRIYAEIGRAGGRAGRKLGMSTGVGMGGSARSSVTFGM